MKKRVFFATMVALTCMLTSCIKGDDLEMLRHPIYVTGEMDPVLGIPVGSGQMNMNDLLTSMSANYSGMVSDTGDVITVEYSMNTTDTIKASSYSSGLKALQTRGLKGSGAKVDYFTKDTILEEEINIDFFSDVEGLDSISLAHVWVDLSVNVHGDIPSFAADKVNVVFDSVEIWYDDHNGTRKQFVNPALDAFNVSIPDLRDTILMSFPTMDMESMVNERPSKMIARFHLKINAEPSLFSQNIATMPIKDIIDSVGMSYMVYSAHMDVRMPLSVRIDNMSYSFDVDFGNGVSGLNLDSLLQSIHQGLSSEMTDSKFRLELDNGIPLDLNLTARAYSEDSVLLWTAFSNELIASAATAALNPPDPVEEAVSPTHTSLSVILDHQDIENFKKAKYMKVEFTVNSRNKHVTVKRSDYLTLKAYLQVHPTVNINVQIH